MAYELDFMGLFCQTTFGLFFSVLLPGAWEVDFHRMIGKPGRQIKGKLLRASSDLYILYYLVVYMP